MSKLRFCHIVCLAVGISASASFAQGGADAETLPVFDAHLHYNWEPTPFYSLTTALRLFRQQRVTGILVNSRPNDGTRALMEAQTDDLWVVGFIRPYRVRSDVQTWFNDLSIFELIKTEYARGGYQGIGEFHLTGKAAESPLVKKLVDFAVDKNLWLQAHADEEALLILYRHNPKARIIWAHSGFSTTPKQLEPLFSQHPGLIGELSYRHDVTDGTGHLTAEWRRLFERYPDRFLLGSDTWINERWSRYGATMGEYRSWLKQLPSAIAEKIAWRNAEHLFAH